MIDMYTIFKEVDPVVKHRGVHLDLKGLQPTAGRLLALLELFAAARYTFVLVEWEDSFPWTVDEGFRSPTAYSPGEITACVERARELGLELIPLVQCLGHMQTPLSVPGYEALREIPDKESDLNPLAPGARALIQDMVEDVLKLMPDVKHFHLGGDEAWDFGRNPDTKAFLEQHGKSALYLYHVGPILDFLVKRQIRPILWHDMMIDWDGAALTTLAAKCDLMVWSYQGNPRDAGRHCNAELIKRFSEHGCNLWGAGAYKGTEGHDADLPDLPMHLENAAAWVDLSRDTDLVGVVATAWSRYNVGKIQCQPIDACLDSLVVVAVVLHDGHLPKDGVQGCIEALASIGERDRFEACRGIMARLAEERSKGWRQVLNARQSLALARHEPRRASTRNLKTGLIGLTRLRNIVGRLNQIASEMPIVFDGLMPTVWINEYTRTRVQPFRDELSALNKEFADLGEPQANGHI